MRSGDGIVGLPVMDLATGSQVGIVRNLIFNRSQDRLLGIVIDEGGWFRDAKVIPFEAVWKLGENAVILADAGAVLAVDEQARLKTFIAENSSVKGMRLMTESGKEIGVVDEVMFDPVTGMVEAFRISGGLLQDLLEGKEILPVPPGATAGEDVIIIPDSAMTTLVRGENRSET
ncbi:MAG: PRC-barrel domain-containing protein [bacterium]|jgi:uncharacterized protein YrrD